MLELLDYTEAFALMKRALPDNRAGIFKLLNRYRVIRARDDGRYDITSVGGLLFAEDLDDFPLLERKPLRVIQYEGRNKALTKREWEDPPSRRGYGVGFETAISVINGWLPRNEPIRQALRESVPV